VSVVRRLVSMQVVRITALLAGLVLVVVLCEASSALALPGPPLSLPVDVRGLFGALKSLVLGGVDWTVDSAAAFVMNLLGGLVKVLIPRSWIREGLSIISWMVAVPDYTAQISTPGGGRTYGFAGVNALRGLCMWLGMAVAPLSLLYATSRAWSGQGDHVAAPLTRVFVAGVGVLSYTWLWAQSVALTNQITTAFLGVSAVTTGIQKMFELLIAGGALAGLPFIGLVLMGVGGVGLLALIFVKVLLVLVGALVYVTGPLMPGIAATQRGDAIARAWCSLTAALFALAPLWTLVFALSAVLINDAASAGAIIGGNSALGRLLGGVVIAMAAIAGFFLNIKLTKALAGIVGAQLSGLLALAGHGGVRGLLGGGGSARAGAGAGQGPAGVAAASLRGFGAKVAGGASGAAGALLPAGRGGAVLAGAGALAHGGLIGAGATLAGRGLQGAAASRVGQAAGATRAGAIATRAARGARRGWNATSATTPDRATPDLAATPTSAAATTGAQPQGRPGGGAPLAGASSQTAPRSSSTRVPGGPRDQPAGGSASAGTPPTAPTSSPSPSDRSNDSARNAFGQAAKATRTQAFKQRLGRGRGRGRGRRS
jgi:hypothetical protein